MLLSSRHSAQVKTASFPTGAILPAFRRDDDPSLGGCKYRSWPRNSKKFGWASTRKRERRIASAINRKSGAAASVEPCCNELSRPLLPPCRCFGATGTVCISGNHQRGGDSLAHHARKSTLRSVGNCQCSFSLKRPPVLPAPFSVDILHLPLAEFDVAYARCRSGTCSAKKSHHGAALSVRLPERPDADRVKNDLLDLARTENAGFLISSNRAPNSRSHKATVRPPQRFADHLETSAV